VTAINRQPAGILGLLGIKNGGEYPRDLSNVLVPTWDMTDLYLLNASEYLTRTDNATVPGTIQTDGPVPGEVWAVTEFGARTGNLAAAETIQFALGLFGPGTAPVYVPLTSVSSASAVAGDRAQAAILRPVRLNPGETLGVFITDITTVGNVPVITSLRFTRLRV